MIVGVVDDVTAGNGVGVCPNAEQTNRKVMMKNCVAMLTDNLIKRIQISRLLFGTSIKRLAPSEPNSGEFWHSALPKTSARAEGLSCHALD